MSGLMGKKGQSTADERLNAIQVNQSNYGNPIPLTYGKTRVPMTLGWYGAFTAIAHTEKNPGGKGGGGGGSHTSYTYTAAVVMLLGEGQITGIGTVWSDKAQVSLSDLGLTLFNGAGGQTPWSFLTTNFPAEAIGYDHTAYVAAGALDLSSSAALPNLTFEMKGLLPHNPGTIDDAEPSDILIDYCTDAVHGCEFPFLGSLQGAGDTYESYCIAMGFFLSPDERQQRAAADFIVEILKVTNSGCVWSAGALKIVPFADAAVTGNGRTYTPDLTPIFTFGDGDYLYEDGEDPVLVTRKAPAERFNIVRVEFLNRANQYNVEPAEAKDANDIAINGERAMPTIVLHCITIASVARLVAQLILQRQLYVVNSYSTKVRPDYSLLEPLDYVGLNDSVLGLSNKLVRLTETDDSEDDEFAITGEEVLVGTANAPLYNWQAAQGYAANYNAAPGSVSTPLIFPAPPLLVDTNGGYELWIAAAGVGALWGGCDVYMSLDNSSYGYIGTILGSARYGDLTATLASGTDPDTTHTLSVQLVDTDLQLLSGAAADVANNRTLIYVDGEIMAYQTATLTGPGAYNLTTLRRGQYGSTPASHSSGTKFARIDGALFRVPYDAGMIGQTAYFKFVSFNQYGGGYETLAGATAYSKVLAAVNAGQLNPAPLTLVGRNVTVQGDRAFKSGGTSGTWDADAYSLQGYLNGAFVSFRPVVTNLDFMVGLNTDPTTDSSFSSIDFALYCVGSGVLQAYESGSLAQTFGSFAAGDDLSVTYDGAIVRYLQNGAVLREVMAGPGKKFYLDSTFCLAQATVSDIRFGPYGTAAPVLYNARGNCIVSDTNAQKVGGSSAWDSDIYSLKGYPSCHVSFKPNQANAHLMIGLNTDPLTDLDWGSIDYAFYCVGDGTWQIRESGGASVGPTGSYTASTEFAITYDASTVTYYVNGAVVRTASVSGLTLYLDSSFLTPGCGVNSLRFGPTTNLAVADTAQIGLNAATSIYGASGTGGSWSGTMASPDTVASVTVPAQPFACDVVVTLNANMGLTANGSGFAGIWVYLDITNHSIDNTLGNAVVLAYVAGQVSGNRVSVEGTFSLAANTSQTYYAFGFHANSAGSWKNDIHIKAEIIKR